MCNRKKIQNIKIKKRKEISMELYSNYSFIQIQYFQGKPNELFPEAEFESHQLPGGKLQLSPHGKWLASCGTDGAVQLRAMGTLVCMYSLIYLRNITSSYTIMDKTFPLF